MATHTRFEARRRTALWTSVLAAGLLLAVQLAGASMTAPRTWATAAAAASPIAPKAYVALFDYNEVAVVDTGTNQVLTRLAGLLGAHDLVASPDGRRAYVVSTDGGTPFLAVLDLATHRIARRVALDAVPVGLRFGTGARRLYLAMGDRHSILVFDTDRAGIAARIEIPGGPRSPFATVEGRSMLVVSQGDGALDVVDLARGVVADKVQVGRAPSGVAVAAGGHTAYVADEGSDDLAVVDLDRRTIVTTIAVGYGPTEIVLQPRTPAQRPALQVTVEPSNETPDGFEQFRPGLHLAPDHF